MNVNSKYFYIYGGTCHMRNKVMKVHVIYLTQVQAIQSSIMNMILKMKTGFSLFYYLIALKLT